MALRRFELGYWPITTLCCAVAQNAVMSFVKLVSHAAEEARYDFALQFPVYDADAGDD